MEKKKPRVLHVTKRYPPYIGGIETVCYDLCSSLKDEFEQKVLCFNDEKRTIEENYDGIDLIRVGVPFVVASQPISFSYKKEIYKVINEFKPDIIHFDYPNPLSSRYLLKAMEKFKFNGKFQLFWHMDIVKQKIIEPFFKKDILKLLDIADQTIITTPKYLENTTYLPSYPHKEKIRILPLKVGEERLKITEVQINKAKEIKELNNGKTICFFFGRHVEYKGIKHIIEAGKYLPKDKYIFYIGGKGPLTEKLKEQAKGMDNVVFLGRVSDDDVNSYLMACDIFLFPSITRNEAFGISLAEALWFGKPAVTFTIPGSGVNWVSVNNETGLEVENGNSEKYAEAIKDLSEDTNLYKKLADGAYERSHTYFNKEYFKDKASKYYKELTHI